MATSCARYTACLPKVNAEDRLYADLDALGVAHRTYEHEAVFTVEESAHLHEEIPGAHVKNLFLKDGGGRFWLVTVPADKRVALKELPDAIGCKRVSFGNADHLDRLLGVSPGSVTPLAAINDADGEVTVVIDTALADAELVNVHPLRNTASTALSGEGLLAALRHWAHEPLIADIPVQA